MPERNSPTWRKAQLSSSADGASRFFSKWRLRITMSFWHAELADPGTVLHENVSFGFDVGYSATVVWHGFICWIGIWGTFQTLNDFWHIWSISVRHCILEKIFPIFSFGSLYSLDGITACINPCLPVLADCLTKVIVNVDFSSHVWSHPRIGFLFQLWFPNASDYSRCQNIRNEWPKCYQRNKSGFKLSSYKKNNKNWKKLLIGQLNINSLRNKFDLVTYQIKDNVDILMITETKLDESFPIEKFFINIFRNPCSKQARNLKFKWLQLDLNPQPLTS